MVRTTNKRQPKKVSNSHKKHGFIFIAIGIILLTFVSAGAGFQFHSWLAYQNEQPNQERLTRITTIYKSLAIGPDYRLDSSSLFGDKRIYEWDKSRSYSSSQTYQRGASVPETVAELRKKIEAAGFSFFHEPYPGSTTIELHFRSENKEYIRLSVSSKPRDDALRNEILMGNTLSDEVIELDPNTGPSNVVIKVNLDDNNE